MNLKQVRIPYAVLRKLPDVLRENHFKVKCVVRTAPNDLFVYDIFGKDEEVVVGGLAVDIGTTTVSAVLINMETGEILAKASSGNGQIRFGADVINRIIEQQKPGGKKKLQDAVIKETINPMIAQMCKSAGIPASHIYRMSVGANTTMNHLFAGINADPVRMEPYIPAFFKTNSLFASDVGIAINKDAHIIIAPNIGSYVIAFEKDAGSVKDIEITEVDIDNFIRAKGAIFSAIRTMINSLDFDVSMIDDVYVAGGIGSGINMRNAVNIGMFPDIPLEKFHYIGNSSLTGSYLMLLSTEAEKKTYELAANMTYMELSTVPTYMDEFVGACFIPHTDTGMFPDVMNDLQNRK